MSRAIVLDANILMRGVLGENVPALLVRYSDNAVFYTPEYCYLEAAKHLPLVLKKRSIDPEEAMEKLLRLRRIVIPVDEAVYAAGKNSALKRIEKRDRNDWPVLALAMVLDCPVWTEDTDFFGSGVATWRSGTVELYLAG